MKEDKNLKKVQSVLTQDEAIEKSFSFKGYQVHATNRRLLRTEGKAIRDFDYTHISSVEYLSKRHWEYVILGVLFAAVCYVIGEILGDMTILQIAGIALGIILIIIGIIIKTELIITHVVGVNDPVEYKGSRQDLNSLLKIIREKRSTAQPVDYKEIEEKDFTDTLRKLAELRDEGIITQEEFENKKSQILQNSD
jgi:hypothetical protein